MSQLVLQIVAGGAFAVSLAAIIDLLSRPGPRFQVRRFLIGLGWHLLAAGTGVYLSMTVLPFRALFPISCWVYLGYWLYGRRKIRDRDRRQ